MGPLIDAELERTDRRHAQLTRLSHELVNKTIPPWFILPFSLQVDALSLYHNLMREAPAPQYYGGFPGAVPPPGVVGGPPGQPMGGYMPMPGGPPPPHQHMGQRCNDKGRAHQDVAYRIKVEWRRLEAMA